MPLANGSQWSGYALKHDRDYWLSCGESGRKAAAKDALDRKTAVRGTVIACEPGRFTAWIVQWRADGETGTHETLPHLLEVATE